MADRAGRPRMIVATLAVLTFVAGGGAGVMALHLAKRPHGPEGRDRPESRDRPGRGMRGGPPFERLIAELGLTEEQTAQVRAVLEAKQPTFEQLFERFRAEMDQIREETHQAVRAALPTEKHEAFDTLYAERRRGHGEREGFGRRMRSPRRYDQDGDGTVTREEWQGPREMFAELDRDGDGVLRDEELQERRGPRRHDQDGDGTVTREEWRGPEEMFSELDRDGDGVLRGEELQGRGSRRRPPDMEPPAPMPPSDDMPPRPEAPPGATEETRQQQ